MARIRTIKPSFWSDERVSDLSRDARLLLVGLISFADDDGRFAASIPAIIGYVFPYDDLPAPKVRKWLEEIASVGVIRLYRINNREYGYFPNYRTHQRISHPQPSTFPPPSVNGSTPNRSMIPQAGAE